MKIPRLESLIILVFFGCVALWGVSKCSGRRAELAPSSKDNETDPEERPTRRDTVFVPQKPAPTPYTAPTQTPSTPAPGSPAPSQPATSAKLPPAIRSPRRRINTCEQTSSSR